MSDNDQDPLDELVRGSTALRSLFQQPKPIQMATPPMKGIVDYLNEMFSSAQAISALAYDLEEWKANKPEGHQVKVTMLTIDGEAMRVRMIKPVGFQMFTAVGRLNGEEHCISGHISRLVIDISYENLEGQDVLDFTIELPESAH